MSDAYKQMLKDKIDRCTNPLDLAAIEARLYGPAGSVSVRAVVDHDAQRRSMHADRLAGHRLQQAELDARRDRERDALMQAVQAPRA
jgi:hypothetical protein